MNANPWTQVSLPVTLNDLLEARETAIRMMADARKLTDKAKHTLYQVGTYLMVGVIPMLATQYIHPWQFGHGETKKTGLWLHKLPPLEPTNIVEGRENRVHRLPPSADRWKIRSETYQGIADAMASQWGK